MKQRKSEELYHRACALFPGGVNSPVRAFRSVGGTPLFFERGKASHLYDVDGNEYLDFVGSWGPLILGHACPEVVNAIRDSAGRGTSFGAPTRAEILLADRIQEAFPSMQMMRLVNSGTEATMSALRVARGFTGKTSVLKFEGCYHGHHDSLLTAAGSGVATFDLPDSAGVPPNYSRNTFSMPFNDKEALDKLPSEVTADLAAVIVEPVAANMGLILPLPGFLEKLREFTRQKEALLIFDEVITGFRLCYGGAQQCYEVQPDLTCLGKIVGGGMPLAVYGGRQEIMQKVAPLGPVYQAGTLSGNPVAASAGLATLELLREPDLYSNLEKATRIFLAPIQETIRKENLPVSLVSIGSMFTIFFRKEVPTNFREAKECDTKRYATFFWKLLEKGIYVAPSQFETNFVSAAHSSAEMRHASEIFQQALLHACGNV